MKKDDDLEILNIGLTGITVKTNLPIGTPIEEEEEEEERPIIYSVPTQIVRYLFIINSIIWFSLAIFGIVPAQILLRFSYPFVSLILFICSLVFSVIFLGALFFVKQHTALVYVFFGVWLFSVYVLIFSVAAYFQTIGPFQGCLMLFLSSISILVYCLYVKKRPNGVWAGFIMFFVSIIIWSVGLVAFIQEQDWIMSGVLFFICVIFFPVYSGIFIHYSYKRFNIGEFDRLLVCFYTDFFVFPIQWIYAKHVEKKMDDSFVLVGENATVPMNA
jgi:hypothetical protein